MAASPVARTDNIGYGQNNSVGSPAAGSAACNSRPGGSSDHVDIPLTNLNGDTGLQKQACNFRCQR